ncbi:hypothetical protein N2603_36260 [Bradyrhizobium huanghuaihaiense]|uniref:DUF6894 family protein n=1 Tax=Bradyrhizobium huanghuaihaiense TaxID=990078 RepID=UPI0021A9B526|nr:hypothetical protein [Bradyrhizobium sp. CB3035]UWU75442.1 hypothetical protein N2603_36260 [Bradyrhizobium sp. CB3035]
MARYYFDLRDGTELFHDEEGLELPTVRAAEVEAARALGGMARDLEPTSEGRDLAIEVRNESGPLFQAALVFTINKSMQ